MGLFGDDPVYYGEGNRPDCAKRKTGILGWFGGIVGFPKDPCYALPDPEHVPCTPDDTVTRTK